MVVFSKLLAGISFEGMGQGQFLEEVVFLTSGPSEGLWRLVPWIPLFLG